MSKVTFKRGNKAFIDALPIVDGQLIYNTETGETFEDVGDKRIPTGGGRGSSGGTTDHNTLKNRELADQHPIEAISGLKEALDTKQPSGDYLTGNQVDAKIKAASDYEAVKTKGYSGTKEEYDVNLRQSIELWDRDTSGFVPVVVVDGETVNWVKGSYWKESGLQESSQYTQKYYSSPEKIRIAPNCHYTAVGINGDIMLYDSTGGNGKRVIWNAPAQTLKFDTDSTHRYMVVNTIITGIWTPQRVVITRTTISQAEIDALPANTKKLKNLYGKKVVCFGDSLFGLHRGDTSAPAYAAQECGATVYNCGFSGCRMAVHTLEGYKPFSMWALSKAIHNGDWTSQDAAAAGTEVPAYFKDQLAILKSIDFADTDFAVIHYGTNDFAAGVPLPLDNPNNPLDYNSICGALRYSINQLQTAYPKLQIYVSLPAYRYWVEDGQTIFAENKVRNGIHLSDVCAGLAGVARQYNLPVIDGYHGLNINKDNASTYLEDGTHHNQIGRKRFGTFIGECLTAGTDGFGFYGTGSGSGVSEARVNELINAAIGNAMKGAY